jgi:hypothetical protein
MNHALYQHSEYDIAEDSGTITIMMSITMGKALRHWNVDGGHNLPTSPPKQGWQTASKECASFS